MAWSKLKNIVLVILVVTNIFLLFLVLGQEFRSARYQSDVLNDAIALLAESGIALDRDILPKEIPLPQTIERDPAGEAAAATALLGEGTVQTSASTVLTAFSGENGTAYFRSGGGFDARFSPSAYPLNGKTPENHAVQTARLLGGTWQILSAEHGEQTLITLQQSWQNIPVFSATATAIYRDDRLVSLSGTRISGTPAPKPDPAPDLPTLLVRFRAGVTQSGDVCSAITALEPGYEQSAPLSGTADLTPLLRIKTDTKTYYQNAQTGVITPQ